MQCYNVTYESHVMLGTRDAKPVLSICLTCRDGREGCQGHVRGGTRLAEAVLRRVQITRVSEVDLRGVRCMSQCKRPCIVSISAQGRFTYMFGDLDPENLDHIEALLELTARYKVVPEGFLTRDERPKPLRASILGRLPPLGSASSLVTSLEPTTEA